MINHLSNRSFLAGFMSALVLFFALAALMTAGCAESATSPVYFTGDVKVTHASAAAACTELGAEHVADLDIAAQACDADGIDSCWTGVDIDPSRGYVVQAEILYPIDYETGLYTGFEAFPVCVVY